MWQNTGTCRFGDGCKFAHGERSGSDPRGQGQGAQGPTVQSRGSNDRPEDVDLQRQMTEVLGMVKQLNQMATNTAGSKPLEPSENGQVANGSSALPEVTRERATHQLSEEDQGLASRLFVPQRSTYIEDEGCMQRKTTEGTVLDFARLAR